LLIYIVIILLLSLPLPSPSLLIDMIEYIKNRINGFVKVVEGDDVNINIISKQYNVNNISAIGDINYRTTESYIHYKNVNTGRNFNTSLLLTILSDKSIIGDSIIATGEGNQFLMLGKSTQVKGNIIGFTTVAYFDDDNVKS